MVRKDCLTSIKFLDSPSHLDNGMAARGITERRRNRGGAMRLLLTAAAALAVATPAYAGGIENVRSLDIAVSGSIRQHCAMGSVPDMDFGNLQRRGLGVQTQVAFDCNVPFTMTIKGAHGALTHTTMPNGQGPYGGALPYSLSVEMPV